MYCETTMLFSVGNINCANNPTPVEKKIKYSFFYKAAFFKFVLANLHDISKNPFTLSLNDHDVHSGEF